MGPILLSLILLTVAAGIFAAARANRFVGAFLLAGVAVFSAFGFLASFEFPGINAFKIGYALVGSSAAISAVWLLAKRGGPRMGH